MPKLIFLFAVLLIMANGCKKDPVVKVSEVLTKSNCDTVFVIYPALDTVYPSPYLAVYPGSWWIYDNGVVDSAFEWVNAPIYSMIKDENDCPTITIENKVLVRTSQGIIMGKNRLTNDTINYASAFTPKVLDFEEGWTKNGASQGDYYMRNTISVDSVFDLKTVNGETYNDVILVVVQKQTVYYHFNSGPSRYFYNYYAKNVGLIYSKSYYPAVSPENLKTEMGLNDYYITPH